MGLEGLPQRQKFLCLRRETVGSPYVGLRQTTRKRTRYSV